MTRIKSHAAIGLALLVVFALWSPAIRVARAEGEQTIELHITKTTDVLNDAEQKIGELRPDDSGAGVTYVPNEGEAIPNVTVTYTLGNSDISQQDHIPEGKTMVTLRWIPEASEQEETLQVWIDTSLAVDGLESRHAADSSEIGSLKMEIESLTNRLDQANETIIANAQVAENAAGRSERTPWAFNWNATVFQVVVCALGLLGLISLIWIGISLRRGVARIEDVSGHVNSLDARLKEGVTVKNTVRVEQTGWPQDGRVMIGAESLEKLSADIRRAVDWNEKNRTKLPPDKPPVVYPPGREPDLLALANRLAGISYGAQWYEQIKNAGYRVVLLTANPRERGSLIADTTGNSILACLTTGSDAEVGYLIPSFQDPRADEPDWNDYYLVKEDPSVQNYRIEELTQMHPGTRNVLYTQVKRHSSQALNLRLSDKNAPRYSGAFCDRCEVIAAAAQHD
ncbi:MAG: hypothetical protein R2912_05945 [Eubacteriales bacterium]